ncbi:hypothetical protein GJ744_007977 [Endocarpon pusillum]|uniref:Uncharacterized protein n=1 Tax=Endocarpon pusillum TaxID=364733 RepID=A0A8H7AJR1_9EURO|nr:hypothetical protein GJ744_007977 [Endocarpon pusillum]
MDSSTISSLSSPPPSDVLDVDDILMDEAPLEAPLASSGPLPPLPPLRCFLTYLIHRVLKLRQQITMICTMNIEDLEKDILSADEWNQLEEMEAILAPFYKVTKRLEGNAKEGHHGPTWEALPAVELLLEHLERLKRIHKTKYLATSVNLA